MTGEFTPLIFMSLFHAQAPRTLILLCFFFFFCARGRLPRAHDAQDTTKQTGAFSLPLFLYISGREAWQSLDSTFMRKAASRAPLSSSSATEARTMLVS